MRPDAFLKAFTQCRFRRCRIKLPAQFRIALLALVALLVLSGCRQDMQNQPKFVPLRSSEFFPDHRSARYPVPGTVPRLDNVTMDAQQLDPASYFLSGKHGNAFGNDLPAELPLSRELMERGQNRYNIYCTPCHARVGDGNGMIVQRGFKHPPSFHVQRLRNAPIGYFYDIMSNGLGAMPDYAAQVTPADRWAIAVYIRALQLSQNATEADVAPADLKKLTQPQENGIKVPSTSTTSPTALQPQGGVKP
jgi:mono/diheme cytochrome c family protein